MDRECEDNEKECAVYVYLSVLVAFPKSLWNRVSKEGEYQFIRGGVGEVGYRESRGRKSRQEREKKRAIDKRKYGEE